MDLNINQYKIKSSDGYYTSEKEEIPNIKNLNCRKKIRSTLYPIVNKSNWV